MKDIKPKLIELFKKDYCTPQIARIAKQLKEPSTTIHYNIKRLEEEGIIKTYKAVFDYKKIEEGFCTFILINLSPDEYGNPERIAKELAKHHEIESVDICTGDWELIVKVRVKDQDEYYQLVKNVISRKGVVKIKSLISFKQIKTEFVEVHTN
ncbi:Lrp/AsnC family transcriptional regulator [Candidatus Woesearchaeota archaeon]|nr:Lrp/AsnC family transcriptional regulator [Candidatus Woesearchaeota archaeon]